MTCIVDECQSARRYSSGYCPKHYQRVKTHGSPDVVLPAVNPPVRFGEEHPRWRGNDVSYRVLHQRIRFHRGKASEHACAECGTVAKDWAYDGTDVNAKVGLTGGSFCEYSTDESKYVPMCRPCHKVFDDGRVAANG